MGQTKDDEILRRAAELQQAGDTKAAFETYRKLYPRHKSDPQFLMHMAIAALSSGKDGQAKTLARQVLKLRPDAGSAHNLLGAVALRAGDGPGAVTHFQDYVATAPERADAHLNLAEALNQLGRAEEAEPHLAHACALTPDQSRPHYLHGVCLHSLGRFDTAAESLHRAVALQPDYAGAWKLLAELGALDADADMPALKAAMQKLQNGGAESAKLHAAIATLHERAGAFDAAFDHFDQANRAMRATFAYDVADDEAFMHDIAEVFGPDLVKRLQGQCRGGDPYIFILGMPRSGTTLAEQILAAYEDVHPGGELSFLDEALKRHGEARGRYPACAARWKPKALRAMAADYTDRVADLRPRGRLVTDKMPRNFLHVGLIRALFPDARIVHVTRDPVDTCLGNFRQIFTGGQNFSYAQTDVARYYLAYRRLMEHWRALFADDMLEVRYEALVQNPAGEARRLVEHCGLTWDESCLDLKAERAVQTASAAQVRGAIRTDYLERWRMYEARLGPMLDILRKS